MLISRGAAAEEDKRLFAGVGDCMNLAWWNRDRIASDDLDLLLGDLHEPFAAENVIDFLGPSMVMRRRSPSRRQACFRQTLIANTRIAMCQQFADLRTVFGCKRVYAVDVMNIQR